MTSLLPSGIALGCVAVLALYLTHVRSISDDTSTLRRAAIGLLVATLAQGLHFAEEALTGFHESLPASFGQPAMSYQFFLAFNLSWLAIWIASTRGILSRRKIAFFAGWFLAIAGVLNAFAHPLLAVSARAYFPGLLTSPIVGIAAAVLWARLRDATVQPSA